MPRASATRGGASGSISSPSRASASSARCLCRSPVTVREGQAAEVDLGLARATRRRLVRPVVEGGLRVGPGSRAASPAANDATRRRPRSSARCRPVLRPADGRPEVADGGGRVLQAHRRVRRAAVRWPRARCPRGRPVPRVATAAAPGSPSRSTASWAATAAASTWAVARGAQRAGRFAGGRPVAQPVRPRAAGVVGRVALGGLPQRWRDAGGAAGRGAASVGELAQAVVAERQTGRRIAAAIVEDVRLDGRSDRPARRSSTGWSSATATPDLVDGRREDGRRPNGVGGEARKRIEPVRRGWPRPTGWWPHRGRGRRPARARSIRSAVAAVHEVVDLGRRQRRGSEAVDDELARLVRSTADGGPEPGRRRTDQIDEERLGVALGVVRCGRWPREAAAPCAPGRRRSRSRSALDRSSHWMSSMTTHRGRMAATRSPTSRTPSNNRAWRSGPSSSAASTGRSATAIGHAPRGGAAGRRHGPGRGPRHAGAGSRAATISPRTWTNGRKGAPPSSWRTAWPVATSQPSAAKALTGLGHEPGSADAGLTRDEDGLWRTGARIVRRGAEPPKRVIATDHPGSRRSHRRDDRCASSAGGAGDRPGELDAEPLPRAAQPGADAAVRATARPRPAPHRSPQPPRRGAAADPRADSRSRADARSADASRSSTVSSALVASGGRGRRSAVRRTT